MGRGWEGDGKGMGEPMVVNDFSAKFVQLSEQNQKYIIAVQQALLYAQSAEKAEKQQKEDGKNET